MKKHIFKPSIYIIIAAMIFTLVGCETGQSGVSSDGTVASSASAASSSAAEKLSKFSLPYTTTPFFNPLIPISQSNMALWPLIYDCLAEPDTNYSPVMQLASSVNCQGTVVTVKLKSGVRFSDGSALSAKDVKYTYEYVLKHTESPYYSRLSNINSIKADGLTVTITLKTPDPLFANMLDVPIIKKESDLSGDAIGTGRYVYSKDGVNAKLTANKNWYKGKPLPFDTITLVNIPYSDAVMSSLSIREINYVYSDNGSGASTSATNTENTSVNLNQLVFVGFNTYKTHLNNAHFRRALSYSINRSSLISQVYSNRALGTVLPFNPAWSAVSPPTEHELAADFDAAKTELAAAGGAGTNTSFTLLVNSDNAVRTAAANYVAECFSKAGVKVTVRAVSFNDYKTLISSGNFDMYIGELKLSNNMDISPFLAPGGSAAYACVSDSRTLFAFNSWRQGTSNISSVADTFTSEMPFIPLCYRLGTVTYTNGLTGVIATDGDIFFDFENWNK